MLDNLKLHVRDNDYMVEFTFEAAESEVVQDAFDYFSGALMLKGLTTMKSEDEMTEDEKTKAKISQLDSMVKGISAVPKLAIDLLYMGLLEHHGKLGDITNDIRNRDDAKILYKEFCKENADSELAMHSGLFDALKAQMEKDGFFKRIGLTKMQEMFAQTETDNVIPMKKKTPTKKTVTPKAKI